jgi:hypothetical protein
MSSAEIRMPLAVIEVTNLADLIDQFVDVITATDSAHDPAVARLTPNPYPEDAEASAEFVSATHADLLGRRAAEASVVRDALKTLLETSDERDERAEVDLVVEAHQIDVWLRVLTALRLVIANRLGITDDTDFEDTDDPRYSVFHWLGFRLDALIALADELDESTEESFPTEE